MNKLALVSLCGMVLALLAAALVFPLLIAYVGEESKQTDAFLWAIAVSGGTGVALLAVARGRYRAIGFREGFVAVALGWVVLSAFGALPFWWSGDIPRYLDAYFETMSGFTTTGATILESPADLGPSLLFWRSMVQWFGGMGIVVLTVAILPFLGAGGNQLFAAEAPGPTADKLQPRMHETAKILWAVYVVFTGLQTLLLWPKLGLFDAACHSFTTMATAGFSTQNASVGHFDSAYVDGVITVFMIAAGINFLLHYRMLLGKGVPHFKDSECRMYLGLIVVVTTIITLVLWFENTYSDLGSSFRFASFQVASIISTTGFVTADFDLWPNSCRFLLLALMVIGGCAGSTTGGVKCIRILVLVKYGIREIRQLIHPHAIIPVKVNHRSVDRRVVASIMGFMALYGVLFVICVLAMNLILDLTLWTPPDGPPVDPDYRFLTAIGSVVATLGNIGPGIAGVGAVKNYASIPDVGKVLLIFCMLVGRLEIYSVLVVFLPWTWRR